MKINFKKILPWLILILCVGGFFTWYLLSNRITKEAMESYDKKITEAELSYEGKEYSTAVSTYYAAAEIIPSRVEAYEGIVGIFLAKNRIGDAINIVENSANKLSASDKNILYAMIGDKYYENGSYTEAKDMYIKGSSDLDLGRAYLKLGDFDNAKKQFEKDSYQGEDLDEARLLIAYIVTISDAQAGKNALNGIDPSDKWTPYYEEFAEVLNSLSEDSKYNAAKLSRIYINNGYPYLAIKALEPLESEISEYVEGLYFLGRAYMETKDYDKAVTILDRAISVGNLESDILWVKARALLSKNDLDGAQASYERSLQYQFSQDVLSEYFDILLNNNLALKAKEIHKTYADSNKSVAMYLYGVKIYYSLGDSEKYTYYLNLLSKETLEDSLKKEYLYLAASVSIANDERVQSDNFLKSLFAIDQYNPKYYFLLAQFKEVEGDTEGAKEALEKALELDLDYAITQEASKMLSRLN